jgi:hypothetical protein
VLSKYYQVLGIDDAVAPRHRANVAQGLICTPVVNDDANVGTIDNAVAIEVNDWLDWHLP